MYHTLRPLQVSVLSIIIVRKTFVNLMQGVIKVYLLGILLLVKHIMCKKKVIEESSHVVLDEINNSLASTSLSNEF